MQDNSKKESLQNRINDFFQRNRKGMLIIFCILIFLLAGGITFISLKEVSNKKAIGEVEELSRRYDTLRYVIVADENTASDISAEGFTASDVEELLADLETFAKGKSGYAGGRAWYLKGQIHADKKEWNMAENAWRLSAKAAEKTYLGPLSYFNAAIAAEEQGKTGEAIELFEKSIALPVEFLQAPRAQFSIGRLNETLGNKNAAIEAYRAVTINWPNLSTWVNLSRSRIIVLEGRVGD